MRKKIIREVFVLQVEYSTRSYQTIYFYPVGTGLQPNKSAIVPYSVKDIHAGRAYRITEESDGCNNFIVIEAELLP